MRYIVMEARSGYAIVLDQQGRFKKVVNRGYEIGDEISEIVCFEEIDEKKKKRAWRTNLSTLVAAACFCIVLLIGYQQYMLPFGTVRMTINPDVMISVNKLEYVVDVEGLNQDGNILLDGYRYSFKDIETVSDELVDRAIEQGFLSPGGEVVIQIQSDDEEWKKNTEEKLINELKQHTKEEVEIKTEKKLPSVTIDSEGEIINSSNKESDYGVSDYDTNTGESDYNTSDYRPAENITSGNKSNNSNKSDYDSSDYKDSDHGSNAGTSSAVSTDYEDSNHGNSSGTTSGGNSDYDESDYESNAGSTSSNQSDYEKSDYGNNESDYGNSENDSGSDYEESDYDD